MTYEQWTSVDQYISRLFELDDKILQQALIDSEAAGLPSIAVSPPQGMLLMLLGRAVAARNILEIGTLGGYSAIWLARALPAGGRLITLESDPAHAAVARANIERAGLSDIIELRVGAAAQTLPELHAQGRGPFDFIFIDADKPSIPEYVNWSLRLSRPGTLIVCDNVVRGGAVADPGNLDANVQGVRTFFALAAAEPRLCATAIQTVGMKGYDGLAIAVVV